MKSWRIRLAAVAAASVLAAGAASAAQAVGAATPIGRATARFFDVSNANPSMSVIARAAARMRSEAPGTYSAETEEILSLVDEQIAALEAAPGEGYAALARVQGLKLLAQQAAPLGRMDFERLSRVEEAAAAALSRETASRRDAMAAQVAAIEKALLAGKAVDADAFSARGVYAAAPGVLPGRKAADRAARALRGSGDEAGELAYWGALASPAAGARLGRAVKSKDAAKKAAAVDSLVRAGAVSDLVSAYKKLKPGDPERARLADALLDAGGAARLASLAASRRGGEAAAVLSARADELPVAALVEEFIGSGSVAELKALKQAVGHWPVIDALLARATTGSKAGGSMGALRAIRDVKDPKVRGAVEEAKAYIELSPAGKSLEEGDSLNGYARLFLILGFLIGFPFFFLSIWYHLRASNELSKVHSAPAREA